MYICNCIVHVSHNLVFAITVNCLYSCFFCFRALSTQQGGYVRATNLYYYYYYYYVSHDYFEMCYLNYLFSFPQVKNVQITTLFITNTAICNTALHFKRTSGGQVKVDLRVADGN